MLNADQEVLLSFLRQMKIEFALFGDFTNRLYRWREIHDFGPFWIAENINGELLCSIEKREKGFVLLFDYKNSENFGNFGELKDKILRQQKLEELLKKEGVEITKKELHFNLKDLKQRLDRIFQEFGFCLYPT